ncbi:hypothetical protein INR49_019481 [Caranx melampygus]|nr:hypothetical protein INR49_019481 [Caranx melampygus]
MSRVCHKDLTQDHIEELQNNLTQAVHQTNACVKLQEAAESQMMAAQSQTKAFRSAELSLTRLRLLHRRRRSTKPPPPP